MSDRSRVDVALVVRPHRSSQPSSLESGALCALRAGIPIVGRGAEDFDPYEPWLDARVGTDVVAACDRAIEHRFDALRAEILRCVDPLLRSAGVAPEHLRFTFATSGRDLHLTIAGPDVGKEFVQRLAVRTADVVSGSIRQFAKTDVTYEAVA